MEQIGKLIIISTPYSRESKYVKQIKKIFKDLEVNEIKLDGKINGYRPSFVVIDDMLYNDNFKPLDYPKICGDCKDFGELSYEQMCVLKGKRFGCTTSFIEAKYGNKNTPACSEFKQKRDDATLKIADTN